MNIYSTPLNPVEIKLRNHGHSPAVILEGAPLIWGGDEGPTVAYDGKFPHDGAALYIGRDVICPAAKEWLRWFTKQFSFNDGVAGIEVVSELRSAWIEMSARDAKQAVERRL